MTMTEIRQHYESIQRSWATARTRRELRLQIDTLEELLEALDDDETRSRAGDLWERVNDLQETLRLELAGRHPHPSAVAGRSGY